MWSDTQNSGGGDNRPRAGAGQTSLAVAALDYLARGWSLIPLAGKQPAIRSWKEFQSRPPTPGEVADWFDGCGRRPTGMGIVTGRLSGLVVVDCDSPADGAFWQERCSNSPLTVSTGGGGLHLYYATAVGDEIRNRAGVFRRKIDIRGEGGYVTAPPSLHPSGEQYAWRQCDWSATLPPFDAAWLVDDMQSARLPSSAQAGPVRNAVNYIRRIHAVSGEGGHNATFRAACKLRDAGLSQGEALAVLSGWNETNAAPPWSATDLAHKISSAFNVPTR